MRSPSCRSLICILSVLASGCDSGLAPCDLDGLAGSRVQRLTAQPTFTTAVAVAGDEVVLTIPVEARTRLVTVRLILGDASDRATEVSREFSTSGGEEVRVTFGTLGLPADVYTASFSLRGDADEVPTTYGPLEGADGLVLLHGEGACETEFALPTFTIVESQN